MTFKINRFNRSLKPQHVWLILGVALISLSLVLGGYNIITGWLSQRGSHVEALKNNQPAQTAEPLITGTPTHITIPNVGIDLKVDAGYYYPVSRSWTLSLNDAQWGVMTAKPNNKTGDTFIYAHNRIHVFYTLPRVQPGDEAIVTTDSGHNFTYKYAHNMVTSPTDTSLFNYQGKPILVLQTCTGLWYQNRTLFIFDLEKVD
jgi:LPXTG-site transpeptidase (sortase) family protein